MAQQTETTTETQATTETQTEVKPKIEDVLKKDISTLTPDEEIVLSNYLKEKAKKAKEDTANKKLIDKAKEIIANLKKENFSDSDILKINNYITEYREKLPKGQKKST